MLFGHCFVRSIALVHVEEKCSTSAWIDLGKNLRHGHRVLICGGIIRIRPSFVFGCSPCPQESQTTFVFLVFGPNTHEVATGKCELHGIVAEFKPSAPLYLRLGAVISYSCSNPFALLLINCGLLLISRASSLSSFGLMLDRASSDPHSEYDYQRSHICLLEPQATNRMAASTPSILILGRTQIKQEAAKTKARQRWSGDAKRLS